MNAAARLNLHDGVRVLALLAARGIVACPSCGAPLAARAEPLGGLRCSRCCAPWTNVEACALVWGIPYARAVGQLAALLRCGGA